MVPRVCLVAGKGTRKKNAHCGERLGTSVVCIDDMRIFQRHTYHMETDEDLMRLVQNGDEAAFGVLFDRYAGAVQSFFSRRVNGDEEVAADLTQDIFLVLWSKSQAYRQGQQVRPWLFTIAYNRLKDYYKSVDYQALYTEEVLQTSEEAAEDMTSLRMDERRFDEVLRQVLGQLTEGEQVLFDLRFWEELSVAEIAEVVGVPEGTVKSRLHALTQKLRIRMKPYEYR